MRYTKNVITKNGNQCLIRNCEASDAQAVYDMFNLTHGQTEFLLTYPDENSSDVEQEQQSLMDKKIAIKKLKSVLL